MRGRAANATIQIAVLVAATTSGGCLVSAPADLGSSADGDASIGPVWADIILYYSEGRETQPIVCATVLGSCGGETPACGAQAAVGPADGESYPLAAGAQIAVAFRCGLVRDHGGAADLEIVGAVPTAGGAVVEVSEDGESFQTLELVTGVNPTSSLSRIGLSTARFVRLTNVGVDPIALDAVQAL